MWSKYGRMMKSTVLPKEIMSWKELFLGKLKLDIGKKSPTTFYRDQMKEAAGPKILARGSETHTQKSALLFIFSLTNLEASFHLASLS